MVPALALLPAGAFPATLVLFGAALGFLDLVFFADFVDDLFGAFFAAGVFFAVFLAFFAARDTAEYNLERKPLVFSVFGLLADATR